MDWEILVTDVFQAWFLALSNAEQVDILAMVDVLEIRGPNLSRPQADTLKGTRKVHHLKELRIQHAGRPYRVFYAFDPSRRAILLCGGRKGRRKDTLFYQRMIAVAEREYLQHLKESGI